MSEFENSIVDEDSFHCNNVLKHHEDNEHFRKNFSKDIETVYKAIPCNPFEMDSLSALNNSNPFPPAVATELREMLVKGEGQVCTFIQDRLIMPNIPITKEITKNKFNLLKVEEGKGKQVNFGVSFMNKLRSAIEHRPRSDI